MVNNVLSLATVPIILAKGAGFYRDFGIGRSRGTMPLQIAGNARFGGLYEVAFGLTLGLGILLAWALTPFFIPNPERTAP